MFKGLFRCTALSWLFVCSSSYADVSVAIGDIWGITGSSKSEGLVENYGTILLDGGSLESGMMLNNGIIDFGSNGQLILKNGSSNGDNALIGAGKLSFAAGVYSNPTIFAINGANDGFAGDVSLGHYVQITLNSTKGLGEYGEISAGYSNYLTLELESSQTWNKNIKVNNNSININKTGSGTLYLKGLIDSAQM
jgi:hypothetical protein